MTPDEQERADVAMAVVSRIVQDFREKGAHMDRASLPMLYVGRCDAEDLTAMLGVACGTIAALAEALNLPKDWLEKARGTA